MPIKPPSGDGKPPPRLQQRLAALRSILPFLKMVWSTKPSYAVAIVFVRLSNSLAPLAMLWVGKLLIDTLAANIDSPTPDWDRLVKLVALELCIALFSETLNRLSDLLESLLGDIVNSALSMRLMRTAGNLDLPQLEDPNVRDKLQRARRQTTTQIGLIGQVLMTLQQGVTLVSMLAALVAFNWWLLAILILAILPSFFGETAYVGITYSFQFRWTARRRELDYYRWLTSELDSAREIKLFRLSDYFVGRYADLASKYIDENRSIAVHRATIGAILTTLSTVAYYGAVGVVVYDTIVGVLTIGTFTFLVGSFDRGRELIRRILLSITSSYEQGLNIKDLFEFLNEKPHIVSPPNARVVPRPMQAGIVFENVSFCYPTTDQWALKDVSLQIHPGDRIALVGENGSGKTTLAKLLTRLYDPMEGRILLDGVDLREYNINSLHESVAMLFQDFCRYDLSARENIAVGQIDMLHDDNRIVEAAEMGLASGIIDRLDGKYDQTLGRRFEGGSDLSGGEWQRIALARVYIRRAQLLILDEPTASLDSRSEYGALRNFSSVTNGKTTILISHRFSAVRMAERIIVLHAGRVVEDGSHSALIQHGGHYAQLYRLQADRYLQS